MDEEKKMNETEPVEEQETTIPSEEPMPHEAIVRELEEEEKSESVPWYKELFEWVKAIAVAVVLALLLNHFVFAMVQVDGTSMVPTLQHQERLVITKLFYQPKAKDIVVLKSEALGKYIIKRIIAVPGDVIDIDSATGDVIVNGEVLHEPYISEKLQSGGRANEYPLTIPEDKLFVMGDNRNNSQDSRSLGLIDFDDVVGRASLRVTPFSRFGTLYKNLER